MLVKRDRKIINLLIQGSVLVVVDELTNPTSKNTNLGH